MNFFESQRKARTNTGLLVLIYILAIVLIVLVIYLAIAMFLGHSTGSRSLQQTSQLWNKDLFFSTALGVLGIIFTGTTYRILQLSKGGVAVAESLGGRLVQTNTRDAKERQILNVVEEVAIASGIRIPQVYVLDGEPGINAFAAGYKPNSAVIGISEGCLRLLSRDELQGVVAHEFSHILNGDMRLNIRLMSILSGILMLTILGRILLRSGFHSNYRRRRNENNGGTGIAVLGLIFLLVGSIGAFAAKLIKMAVSRQREYLADASAVQFTRNPEGIAGALIKIGSLQEGSKLQSAKAEEISHLCFANALTGFFSRFSFLSTHPPLVDRIKHIKPNFDGNFPTFHAPEPEDPSTPTEDSQSMADNHRIGGVLNPAAILQMVGTIPESSMQASKETLAKIPDPLSQALENPLDAGAIIAAMLLSDRADIREVQITQVKSQLPQMIFDLMIKHQELADSINEEQRIPIVDLAIYSLKNLSKAQYLQVSLALQTLIDADSQLTIFEFTAFHLFSRTLDEHYQVPRKATHEISDLSKILIPTSQILFLLAHFGDKNSEAAQEAYENACNQLAIHSSARLDKSDQEKLSVKDMQSALEQLERISPRVQEKIFKACLTCISHDQVITTDEAQLIRVIGEFLDCPVPLI